MNTFTVTLTDAELKALAYVAVDPQSWIDNAIHERCRIAMEEIFQHEVTRMLADESITNIPANRDDIVLAAQLPSAAERHEIALNSRLGQE